MERSPWYSAGVQPSTMCGTASGSSTTTALLLPIAEAKASIHSPYAARSAAPPAECWPQSRCGTL